MSDARRKRKKRFSIEQKCKILDAIATGASIRRVANLFDVSKSTVFDIKMNRLRIREIAKNTKALQNDVDIEREAVAEIDSLTVRDVDDNNGSFYINQISDALNNSNHSEFYEEYIKNHIKTEDTEIFYYGGDKYEETSNYELPKKRLRVSEDDADEQKFENTSQKVIQYPSSSKDVQPTTSRGSDGGNKKVSTDSGTLSSLGKQAVQQKINFLPAKTILPGSNIGHRDIIKRLKYVHESKPYRCDQESIMLNNRLIALEKRIDNNLKIQDDLPPHDEDYHFMMSILPTLRELPKHHRLMARMKIQQVLCDMSAEITKSE